MPTRSDDERKEAIDILIKRLLVEEFKHCSIDDAVFISIWLRGLYKSGLNQFFSPLRLISLQETLRHNAVIRHFIEDVHRKYVGIRPKSENPAHALQDIQLFELKLSHTDKRAAKEFLPHSPWLASLYHATRLTAEAPSGRRFLDYLQSAVNAFTLSGNTPLL